MSKTAKKLDDKSVEAYMNKKLRPQEDLLKSPTQKMIINTAPKDENGKNIKEHIGTFHITGTELYADTVKFRPLAVFNKLIKMTQTKDKEGAKKWNYVNQTVFFANYGEPMYDAKGGLACGKIFGDARLRMNPEQKEANNEKAKSFLYLFGLVQFPKTKEWHFVDFRVGGKRIIAVSDAINYKNIGKNHVMSQFIYDLVCVPEDESIHPSLSMTIDQKAGTQDVADILEYDNDISNYVEEHNERIMTQFKKYSAQADAVVHEDDEEETLDIGDDE